LYRANFYPNYIVTFQPRQSRIDEFPPEYRTPIENKVKGAMSRKSSLKMQKALSWMWLFSKYQWGYGKDIKKLFKFKLNFFTLTLSDAQFHSDDWIKIHMLEPMLKWMKRQGCNHYVWKAETQENGNIHFHISSNTFIHYKKFRDKWNNLQYNSGYLERRKRQGKDLEPNSTDVHAVKKDGQFVRYMTNYMKKDIQERTEFKSEKLLMMSNTAIEYSIGMASIAEVGIGAIRRQVEGKIWACSRELLDIKVSFESEDDDFGDIMIKTQDDLKAQWHKHDYCDIWRHNMITMNTKLHPRLAHSMSQAYNKFHSVNKRVQTSKSLHN
jgi:hypothetical protein